MLYFKNLDDIIFNRNKLFRCDELIIVSGYVGPKPVNNLKLLPLKSTVVYGMYGSDGIQRGIHDALVNINHTANNVDVFYSTLPVHSKCYVWRNKGDVVHALIGSANFSTNGIETPFKEVLAETTVDTFDALNDYIDQILKCAITCDDAVVKNNKKKRKTVGANSNVYDPDVCSMPLFIVEGDKEIIPEKSGINWGMAKLSGSHVNINDAYIRIGMDLVEHYPKLFPAKQKEPKDLNNVIRKDHRHNDSIDIVWDDGTTMTALLEGSVPKIENGVKVLYPKQLSTTPRKALLGQYLRERLGVPEGKAITMDDLERYGRKTIDVSLQGEGIYYFDFSVDVGDTSIIIENVNKKITSLNVADNKSEYL